MSVGSVLINLAENAEPAITLIQTVAGLIALLLFTGGLLNIWSAGNANSQKFLASSQRSTYGGAFVQLFIAILFLGIADLELIGIATRSFTGGYTTERLTTGSFSYDPVGPVSENISLSIFAIAVLLQVVGIIAFMKGLFIMNGRANGTTQESYSKGICFMIGGLGCWNIQYVAQVLNNSMGFDFLGLLSLSP